MDPRVTPMIHVEDVRATVDWYVSIGFRALGTGDDGNEMVWAEGGFGSGRVMFSAGGKPGWPHRREVDLYVHTEKIDALHRAFAERGIEVIETPHDTFYGMREVIVRDPNGFWITFGEPAAKTEASA